MINSAEELFVVDENDQPIKPLKRSEVHSTGAWHRVAHIWVHDGEGNILCQRRSLLKDTNPGFWEGFFGGHIAAGVQPQHGALQEVKEELGIDLEPNELDFEFKFQYFSPNNKNNEFLYVYLFIWNGDINCLELEADEVAEVVWNSAENVVDGVAGGLDTKWTQFGYEGRIMDKVLLSKAINSDN